jgi:ABC-2 type transport system ATP-binding protein
MTDRDAYDALDRALGDRAVTRDPIRLTMGIATDGSAAHVRDLLDQVDPTRTTIHRFAIRTATLDDVFLALTGHATSAAPAQEELANV